MDQAPPPEATAVRPRGVGEASIAFFDSAIELVYEQPAYSEVDYVFKHALTQEVAYASVLLERRRQLHDRIAQAIESLAGNRLHELYSELAHHYSRSGNAQKAVDYLQLAGEQAAERGAHAETVAHLTAALELLGGLPASGDHTRQELALQLAIRPALMAVKGYGGRELVRIYRRADELCRQLFEAAEISTDIIIAVDNSGSIVFYNDGARRKLGYSSEEVLGRHVTLIYGDLAEAWRLMSAMRSADRDTAGKTDNFETVLIDKSGNRIPAAISGSFIKDAEGRY